MSFLLDVVNKPHILKQKKHILLMSHMRAYTSLFGHILGSHREIEGYYEMHIGYYSWKSLIRQKQLYYSEHPQKKGAHMMFDKILHNEHLVTQDVIDRDNVIPIFSLREPHETIPSILSLYQRVKPEHPFNNLNFATDYYINRLSHLADVAKNVPNRIHYIDSKMLVSDTTNALSHLTKILGLEIELQPEYASMNKTGKGNSGDHSNELKTGKIQQVEKDKSESEMPSELLNRATDAFNNCRNTLIKLADTALVIG